MGKYQQRSLPAMELFTLCFLFQHLSQALGKRPLFAENDTDDEASISIWPSLAIV